MRHLVAGKKLNRTKAHREALYRNLVSSLVEHGAINTTLSKAKAVQPLAERLVTKARVGNLASRRHLLSFFYRGDLAEKMLNKVAPQFRSREGGYTRVVKLGPRPSDRAEMARLEFVQDINSDSGGPNTGKEAKVVLKKNTKKVRNA